MKKNNTLQDVLYMRCFAVISLVAWHSYCTYICWGYGNSPLNGVYGRLFQFFTPDANMPLFTFLAGYLFCFLLKEKNKYTNFKDFLLNKVHRLLIPFIVLGTLTNLTQINNRFVDVFYGKPSHLWYCLMLFYCYIACWLLKRYGGKKINVFVMVLSCLVVLYKGQAPLSINSPFGLFFPTYYYCYFYIGFLVFNSRDKIIGLLRKYWILVFVLFFFLAFKHVSRLTLFQCITYIALIFFLFNRIAEFPPPSFPTHNYLNLIINSISKCSMGIYVFHHWIIWNIAASGILQSFINEYYIVFPLLCWFLVLLVSWGLSYIFITYTKIGKYLLT